MVVATVAALASFGVLRLHGIFGADTINESGAIRDDSKNIIPKDITYEIFGPAGTRGEVNYLDDSAQPQRAQFNTLPWKLTISTTLTSVFANIVAEASNNAGIGCRITVQGTVLDEQLAKFPEGQAFCLVKSA
ncbi:membrane protein mmpS4 [Mycobacteroides abscessus subsp. abscessus]|uniref:Membrane protein mmpS4 n=3 Tax=Mycobacteroides abscessus TaxID=36809 RepID=A0AB33T585_9MYCO|nr:MmpS family transport accessory protein [Mycobacteroides abscessus]EUA46459.1 conserved membrane family protein [Mycobacteroides abscessus 21]MBE5442142.1 hypothetical protein [Mycobacteroides abscessus]MBE5449202.1 hypothetical protein [Mycobacteroides abscessus]MBE5463544.1 hypothetical protein [Mycobacteroides abscessus]MBE5496666.1 hypothetical protein [Mycobacteroides abscessus]